MMHNASFEALGLDYRYLAFDVNEATLPTAVAGLKVLGARGFNLTMPDKTSWSPSATNLHRCPDHRRCQHGRKRKTDALSAINTDGIGYMQSVKMPVMTSSAKMTLLGGRRRRDRDPGPGGTRRLKGNLCLVETDQPIL